jgi:hypothetical protein
MPNKESFMRNRTQQAPMMTLLITDMLKHGYEIYDVLRHYAQVNAAQGTNITTKHIYDDGASNEASVTMGQNNPGFLRLKKRSF